jgi:hypothetical protein
MTLVAPVWRSPPAPAAASAPGSRSTEAGFVSLGNLSEPLADPYLRIAEGLIIAMAPVMAMLMATRLVAAR